MYANICFIIAIILFALDGLGQFPNSHLLSWGSVAFTAGFIAWEVIAAEKQKEAAKAAQSAVKDHGESTDHSSKPLA